MLALFIEGPVERERRHYILVRALPLGVSGLSTRFGLGPRGTKVHPPQMSSDTPMRELTTSHLNSLKQLIRSEARHLAVDLEDAAVERLARFAVLFFKWNERINLASISDPEELVARHYVDSYAASRFIPPNSRVIDIGSGGGLPALPLAGFRTDILVECFEPIHKKAAFLRTAIRELGLAERALVRGEAVDLPVQPTLAFQADVAMSRATLEPAAWLALGRALVRPGGRVLVFATAHSEGAMPAAGGSLAYARNRRLLCYEPSLGPSDVPRGT